MATTSEACTPALRAQDWGWKIETTVLTTWIPLLIVVAARIWLKIRHRKGLGSDDYTMLISLIPICLGSAFHLVSVHYGLGQHVVCLHPSDASAALKYQYLGEGMNIFSIWLIKVSICFFLLRLIQLTHRIMTWAIWILLIVNTIMNAADMIVWGISKVPINSWWDINVKTTYEVQYAIQFDYAVYATNVLIDLVFALSPIYFLWSVQIKTSRKITLWALLILGLGTAAAGLAKVVLLKDVASGNTDFLFTPIPDDIAALVEQNAGAFIANLPCLSSLVDMAFATLSSVYASITSRASRRSGLGAGEGAGEGPSSEFSQEFSGVSGEGRQVYVQRGGVEHITLSTLSSKGRSVGTSGSGVQDEEALYEATPERKAV